MRVRRREAFGLGAVSAGVVAMIAVAVWPVRRIGHERALPPAERLSDTVRAAVASEMHAHARGMLELMSTATVLDWEGTVAAVDRVLAEPRLARPQSQDATELNATLPPRFFTLQDELRLQLQAVRKAAAAHDAEAFADGFTGATRTCIHCHDAYATGR